MVGLGMEMGTGRVGMRWSCEVVDGRRIFICMSGDVE